MVTVGLNPLTELNVRKLIDQDLRKAQDDADLRRRLANKGYGFRDTRKGRMLITLPHGVELMNLPRFVGDVR